MNMNILFTELEHPDKLNQHFSVNGRKVKKRKKEKLVSHQIKEFIKHHEFIFNI